MQTYTHTCILISAVAGDAYSVLALFCTETHNDDSALSLSVDGDDEQKKRVRIVNNVVNNGINNGVNNGAIVFASSGEGAAEVSAAAGEGKEKEEAQISMKSFVRIMLARSRLVSAEKLATERIRCFATPPHSTVDKTVKTCHDGYNASPSIDNSDGIHCLIISKEVGCLCKKLLVTVLRLTQIKDQGGVGGIEKGIEEVLSEDRTHHSSGEQQFKKTAQEFYLRVFLAFLAQRPRMYVSLCGHSISLPTESKSPIPCEQSDQDWLLTLLTVIIKEVEYQQ